MSWITARRTGAGMGATGPRLAIVPGGNVAALAFAHASEVVPARALELEALMHLPRLASFDGTVETAQADAEVERLSWRLQALYRPALALARPPKAAVALSDLDVGAVDENLAATVTERLHYLHSPRRDSLHLGSFTGGGRLVALVSLSALDLDTVAVTLPFGIHADEALVLSRVFAFDWAPRNAISHFLGQVERHLRGARPEIRLLLTYVNPNLGFDGVSYRATNWTLFAHETGTRYGYLGDRYLTDREIGRLPEAEKARVVYSVMPLAPLRIFARLTRRRDRRVQVAARVLPRP